MKFLFLVLVLFCSSIFSQENEFVDNYDLKLFDPNSPEYIVAQSLNFSKTMNHSEVSNLYLPEELKLLKEGMVSIINEKEGNKLLLYFPEIETKEEFIKLEPNELYVYLMNFVYSFQSSGADQIKALKTKILGKVTEGNEVHVLVRKKIEFQETKFNKIDIFTVIEKNGRYYLKMKSGLKELISQLKR